MKSDKWIHAVLWAFVLYSSVCLTDIIIYKFKLIPHCGFKEYLLTEKIFISLLFLVPMITSVFILKRANSTRFIIDAGLFWFLSAVLCKLVNIPYWVSYMKGFETFAFGPNWLRQDIWFFPYCGSIVGTVIAGIISLLKYMDRVRMPYER